jgi:hypothetical protein
MSRVLASSERYPTVPINTPSAIEITVTVTRRVPLSPFRVDDHLGVLFRWTGVR